MRWFFVLFLLGHFFALQSNLLLGGNLANIRIDPAHGRNLVENLRSRAKSEDTTSNRKEIKNVIPLPLLDEAFTRLKKPGIAPTSLVSTIPVLTKGITFEDRDTPPPAGRYATYTIYGRGLAFANQGTTTKIKLRARFYLTTTSPESIFSRSKNFENSAFLEVKIKNPTADEENIVHKYRIKIRDQQILRLFRLDPRHPLYVSQLHALKHEIKGSVDPKNKYLVGMIFDAIEQLSKESPLFIRPSFAISYERQALKYLENNEREYQITVDKEVRGYRVPQNLSAADFDFSSYFLSQANADRIVAYPDNSRVTEIKIPALASQIANKDQSAVLKKISNDFIGPIFKQTSTLTGFRLNRGKAGHFKQMVKKNHILLAKAA
jgi:hypothetical protein